MAGRDANGPPPARRRAGAGISGLEGEAGETALVQWHDRVGLVPVVRALSSSIFAPPDPVLKDSPPMRAMTGNRAGTRPARYELAAETMPKKYSAASAPGSRPAANATRMTRFTAARVHPP
jgi:hypothetical protein